MTVCTYVVSPDTHSVAVDGEVVVYALAPGSLHVLLGPAAHVWSLLCEQRTVDDLVTELCRLYDAAPSTVGPDVVRVTAELHALGLLVRRPTT